MMKKSDENKVVYSILHNYFDVVQGLILVEFSWYIANPMLV